MLPAHRSYYSTPLSPYPSSRYKVRSAQSVPACTRSVKPGLRELLVGMSYQCRADSRMPVAHAVAGPLSSVGENLPTPTTLVPSPHTPRPAPVPRGGSSS
eukprot:2014234-Rhodomonas_salina.1